MPVQCDKSSKKSDKSKYSGYGIVLDGTSSWCFGNAFAWNVVIFSVYNSSSSHTDNRKNTFLMLGEGPFYDINSSFASTEKKFSINFSKAVTKFRVGFALQWR